MRLTHEEAIRNVLLHPELSKAAIRLYLLVAMAKGESIHYLAPEIVLAVGCTEAGMWKASTALVTSGLVTRSGKGRLSAKINVISSPRIYSQEGDSGGD